MQKQRIAVFLIGLSLVLSACGTPAPEESAQKLETKAEKSTETSVPTPTTEPTQAPTLTPEPTSTSTPTPLSNKCKLPEAAKRGDVGLGFPRYPARMKTTGTVNAVVLFVDFSDKPAQQTPEEVFAMLSPGAPDFYKAVSYGQMDFQLKPHLTWLRMTLPSTSYTRAPESYKEHRAYIQAAVKLADPEVDFSNADAVYVIANPTVTALKFGPAFSGSPEGGGIIADGVTIFNGATSGYDLKDWGFLWLNHEVLHTMGLADLYAHAGSTHRFVGDFSVMGLVSGKAPELLAYERWLLDWLSADQIFCQQSKDETTVLTPVEIAGGTKAVIVRTGTTKAVVVESRRALGFDSKLPKAGVLVYSVNTGVLSGEGPIEVFPGKGSTKYSYLLGAGESFTVGKVTVKVVASTAESDTVQVMVNK